MFAKYPTDPISLEWICKAFNESEIEHRQSGFENQVVTDYCNKLLEISPNSSMGMFTKALILYKDNKAVEARDVLKEGMWVYKAVTCIAYFAYPKMCGWNENCR